MYAGCIVQKAQCCMQYIHKALVVFSFLYCSDWAVLHFYDCLSQHLRSNLYCTVLHFHAHTVILCTVLYRTRLLGCTGKSECNFLCDSTGSLCMISFSRLRSLDSVAIILCDFLIYFALLVSFTVL